MPEARYSFETADAYWATPSTDEKTGRPLGAPPLGFHRRSAAPASTQTGIQGGAKPDSYYYCAAEARFVAFE